MGGGGNYGIYRRRDFTEATVSEDVVEGNRSADVEHYQVPKWQSWKFVQREGEDLCALASFCTATGI